MSIQVFTMDVANGTYLFEVGNPSDVGLPYHQLMLDLSSVPTDGYMKVEVRSSSDADWVLVSEGNSIHLVNSAAIQYVAVASHYRFTLSGVIDGAGKTVTVRVFDSDAWMGSQPPAGLYEGLRAETTQTYLEANVKNGVQFEAGAESAAVAAGATVDVVFITTTKPALIKARQLTFTGSKVTARVYKTPVYTGGVAVPIYNLSDINPAVKTVTILSGVTVSNVGTEFGAPTFAYGSSSGAGNSVGTYAVTGLERNLNRDTTYLLRITNGDSVPRDIASYLTWYEGEPDLPRKVL